MKEKVYKILKRYPSLSKYFQEGDIIYYFPMQNGEYKVEDHTQNVLAQYFCYKKLFHQQKDPFIWQDEVENHPEFFEYLPNGVKIIEN